MLGRQRRWLVDAVRVRRRGCVRTWASQADGASSNPLNAVEFRIQRHVETKDLTEHEALPTHHLLSPQKNDAWKVVKLEDLQHVTIPPTWEADLEELQERIGVRFHDVTHLKTALVHHGALTETSIPSDVVTQRLSNRSLEFLGDSILGMAIASYVFQSQPHYQEGQLTRFKAILVNNATLSRVAVFDLQIDRLILVAQEMDLSKPSQEKWYLKGRSTIQAGAVEALIAAVYVDQGLERALTFVNEYILPSAIKYATEEHTWQPVVQLQNLLQAHGYGHPVYTRIPAPSTNKVFEMQLVVRDEVILTGKGSSYREARVNAAEAGYHYYSALLASGKDKSLQE
ncbi:hypothetical protein Poli38472_007451 [Pythium oligandrum]|uniref:Uncharacterized protein n=1 Tax=Pythium oligandrum TaxID=41045 RepID=A0A8K1CQJ0_PYTOL|nr:hypothetical protein Poli38472_007451 [Pythium oligandrum]|eukprot:TMW67779.1 hypothetical protein Poli38472_007451 [Pythium oligandrum]